MGKNNGALPTGPYHDLFRAIAGNFGQLGNYICGPQSEHTYRITISQKSRFDWFAVVTRWNESGGRSVCFGSGHDAVAAILAVSGAIARDAWRPDKFYDPVDATS